MSIATEFLEKFKEKYKPGIKKSELWKYADEIKELLESGYGYKQIYVYLRDFRQIKFKENSVYKFIKRNRDKILNTQTDIEQTTTQPIKVEPVKEEIKKEPIKVEPEPKPKPQPVKPEEPEEEENPLTYKEYSKDYDEAIEVLNPEQLKKTGFSFRKDAWRKLTKEEFKRAEWMLANKPIAFWQIKQKGVYYKTIRNLKNECIEKGHDLRRYLAYLSSLRNKKDNDPAINSLDFFIKKVMDFGD